MAIGIGIACVAAIGLIPMHFMSDQSDGRMDVVTFIVGFSALVLAVIVFDRLRRETAGLQKNKEAAALGPQPGPDPDVLQLNGVDLREALLPSAELQGVEFSEAVLDDANLSSAMMAMSRLTGAKLRRVDLRRASLAGAELKNADLQGADLRGADLRLADLRGASLRDVLLDADTRFWRAVYDDKTTPPAGRTSLDDLGAIHDDLVVEP